MARRILIDERHRHRGQAFVSINPKLERLLLYKGAYEQMKSWHGSDFEAVQIIVDSEEAPGAFWLKPCEPGEPGARNLHRSSANTRVLPVKLLLAELTWKLSKTERFPLVWDEEEQAARVDTGDAGPSV